VAGVERYDLAKAAPLAPLTAAQLNEYAGEYVSEELLNAKYRFVVENGALIAKFRSLPPRPSRPWPRTNSPRRLRHRIRRKGKAVTGLRSTWGAPPASSS